MEYTKKNMDKSCIEFSVELNKEEWENCLLEAFKKNKQHYRIEGFRPGKVPYSVVEKRYGKEVFFEDGMDYALNKYYSEILDKEKEVEPVARPGVDIKEVNAEGFKFAITVAVMPEFEAPKYKELEVKAVKYDVTDEQVDAEIEKARDRACRWIDINDRAVQNGDKVIIDYSGSVDGVKFEGGTAEKQPLDIGSGSFIPGFEDQIIGMKIGESKDINVKFPEQYGAENLAGKDAVFAITLHEIKVKELPALDDEFAKDVSEFDTLKEYKADLKDKMLKEAQQKAQYEEENTLVDTITASAKIELPDALIDEEVDRMMEEFKMRMAYSGLKFEDYVKYSGTTEEAMRTDRRADAEKAVKTRLVLEKIIKEEKLTIEKEEMDAEMAKLAEQAGKSVEDYTKTMDQYAFSGMFNRMLTDKLFAFLRANNKFVD